MEGFAVDWPALHRWDKKTKNKKLTKKPILRDKGLFWLLISVHNHLVLVGKHGRGGLSTAWWLGSQAGETGLGCPCPSSGTAW